MRPTELWYDYQPRITPKTLPQRRKFHPHYLKKQPHVMPEWGSLCQNAQKFRVIGIQF